MSLEPLKNISLNFSSKTIAQIIIFATPIILGLGYGGVTFYNKMVDTIEAAEGLGSIKNDIREMKVQIQSIKERQMESLEGNIRLQEKASDAIALAREASSIAKSTQRELEATTQATKSEVQTSIKAVEDKLDVIKKAVTNPLGR